MNLHRKLISTAVVLSLFMSGLGHAFLDSEKIVVIVPDQIVEGGIIPLVVQVAGYSGDPIKNLALSIKSNPPPFDHAFDVELEVPLAEFIAGTRIRSGSVGMLKGTITLKHQSGKTTVKDFEKGFVQKAIDFSNPDTLAVIFKGIFIFPTNEVGQPQKSSRVKKGRSGVIDVRGLLYHPMLPTSASEPNGYYVKRIEFVHNDGKLATFNTSPVLSNSPYVQLELPSNIDPNTVKLIWTDTKGNTFTK